MNEAHGFVETLLHIRAWVLEHADAAHSQAFERWYQTLFQDPEPWRASFESVARAKGLPLESVDVTLMDLQRDAQRVGPLRPGDDVLMRELRAQVPSELFNASLIWFVSTQSDPGVLRWCSMLTGYE